MFSVSKTKIKNLLVVDGKQYSDNRGYLRELVSEKKIGSKFKFTIVSKSKKNVLRGLHFQNNKSQGKYISVLKGKILDVAVDLRKNSKTFGKYFSIILSEKNCKGVLIPPGFAHGFQTLEKENIVCYSCTEYRSIGNEHALKYNDPQLKIKWMKDKLTMTKKDRNAKTLKELIKNKIIKS
jgi:dTDP-4-dehydrorhamnose 3,5-epimerase|tara:strand:+ start:863 stop:1402 length:540 start_codon:yes stop_codon:yes gene_type:complete